MNSFYLGLGLFFLYSFLGWLAEVAFSAVSRKKFINTGFLTMYGRSVFMNSFYLGLGLFFLYSFLGWLAEVAFSAVSRKKFINTGFLTGPICPIYGVGILFILHFLEPLRDNLFFLFVGSTVVATVLEYVTNRLLEGLTGTKWWDYSRSRFHFGGYVCLAFSAFWGVGAVVIVRWVNPLVVRLLSLIPATIGKVILLGLVILLVLDLIATAGAILRMRHQFIHDGEEPTALQQAASLPGQVILLGLVILLVLDLIATAGAILRMRHQFIHDGEEPTALQQAASLPGQLSEAILGRIQRRVERTVPKLSQHEEAAQAFRNRQEAASNVFAYGCGFYKLIWLFAIGALLGDLIETLYCRVTAGVWMSRSSVLYGQCAVRPVQHCLGLGRRTDDRYAGAPAEPGQSGCISVRCSAGRRVRVCMQRLYRSDVRNHLLGLQWIQVQPRRTHQPALLLLLGYGSRGLDQRGLSFPLQLDRADPHQGGAHCHLGLCGVHVGEHRHLRPGHGPLFQARFRCGYTAHSVEHLPG